MFGNIFSHIFTMQHTFEAHGQKWVEIEPVKAHDDDNMMVIAVGEGAVFPAPLHLVLRPRIKDTKSNDASSK